MIRRHVHDLFGDGDHRLVLLHFELTDAEVGEAGDFEGLSLLHGRLIGFGALIFAQVVVCDVTEIVVPVDFLVDLRCLLLVASLEELTSGDFQTHQDSQLVCQGVLVEVARVLDAKQ